MRDNFNNYHKYILVTVQGECIINDQTLKANLHTPKYREDPRDRPSLSLNVNKYDVSSISWYAFFSNATSNHYYHASMLLDTTLYILSKGFQRSN